MMKSMKRLVAYVSGSVQKTGYRARVIDFATMLGLKGVVENLEDGRVKIVAEGDSDKLKWFEEAINIHDNLIQVSSIEREYSEPRVISPSSTSWWRRVRLTPGWIPQHLY